jgi:hypothetical protein
MTHGLEELFPIQPNPPSIFKTSRLNLQTQLNFYAEPSVSKTFFAPKQLHEADSRPSTVRGSLTPKVAAAEFRKTATSHHYSPQKLISALRSQDASEKFQERANRKHAKFLERLKE